MSTYSLSKENNGIQFYTFKADDDGLVNQYFLRKYFPPSRKQIVDNVIKICFPQPPIPRKKYRKTNTFKTLILLVPSYIIIHFIKCFNGRINFKINSIITKKYNLNIKQFIPELKI